MIKLASVEKLQDFVNTMITLEKICQEWAVQNLDTRWQYYRSFEVKQDYIIINYAYNDIVNNTEYETCYGTKCISWDDLFEFYKTLEL